jgi:hypothetical protein
MVVFWSAAGSPLSCSYWCGAHFFIQGLSWRMQDILDDGRRCLISSTALALKSVVGALFAFCTKTA